MKRFFTLVVVFALALALATPVLALQEEPSSPGISDVVVIFTALVGWPALLLAVTGLLKALGIVKDGATPTFVYWANIAAFVGVAYFVLTGNLDLLASIDAGFGTLAVIVTNIVVLFGVLFPSSLAANKFMYLHVRGYPVVGYSHTRAIGMKNSKKK